MTDTTDEAFMDGGCHCGRIRYTARVTGDDAYACHCRMCRRTSGNVFIAFHNLLKRSVEWLREPDYYASSPIARRGFCAVCGTTLSFDFPDSATIDLTVASFDDPGRFIPTEHVGIESRLAHWRDTAGLPGYRTDENMPLTERWMRTVGKLPD